jgi:hypothetical protein
MGQFGMSLLVFWVVTPCGLVGRYQRFRKEEWGSMFLRNVGIYVQVHMALLDKTKIDIFTAVRNSDLTIWNVVQVNVCNRRIWIIDAP